MSGLISEATGILNFFSIKRFSFFDSNDVKVLQFWESTNGQKIKRDAKKINVGHLFK